MWVYTLPNSVARLKYRPLGIHNLLLSCAVYRRKHKHIDGEFYSCHFDIAIFDLNTAILVLLFPYFTCSLRFSTFFFGKQHTVSTQSIKYQMQMFWFAHSMLSRYNANSATHTNCSWSNRFWNKFQEKPISLLVLSREINSRNLGISKIIEFVY